MSWFFGVSRSQPGTQISLDKGHCDGRPLHVLSLPMLSIVFGGIDETCCYETPGRSSETGWAVVGTGIRVSDSVARLMDKSDWRALLSSGNFPADMLDGHFVALRWNADGVELFTDQLGLRTAYYGKYDAGICFSSRLDWVAQTTGRAEINLSALGGRWLLFNQMDYESCVNGIERLGPGASVFIKNGAVIRHESRPWFPEFGRGKGNRAGELLELFVRAAVDSHRTVSLGLSGGIDSRTLLAILMAERNAGFLVHTFGDPADPDVRISTRIADRFGLRRQYFNEPLADSSDLLLQTRSFAAQNTLVEPASSILKLRYYSGQHENGQMIIDGGLGEIARRQYLNRIVRFGRSALKEKDIGKIFQLLRTPRADIFTREYTREMGSAALKSIERTLASMPGVEEIGVENFVDLLSVRTRLPNFGGPEQARSDACIVNYMPMAQPSFLKAAFATDIRQRTNGRLFKEIVRANEPRLAEFPLVKSGSTYPFGLPPVAAWLAAKIKSKFMKSFSDPMPDRFLANIKEYVLDLAHSGEVHNWHGYDSARIPWIIEEYYRGNKQYRRTVDWWLAFELWRRSLKGQ
jgi:hypothetical protein